MSRAAASARAIKVPMKYHGSHPSARAKIASCEPALLSPRDRPANMSPTAPYARLKASPRKLSTVARSEESVMARRLSACPEQCGR